MAGLTSLFEIAYIWVVLAVWRVRPGALFDREYYLWSNGDVAASGANPLYHFLRDGHAEGRKPHPLFDPTYYRMQYPDVGAAAYNPLLHFLRFGAKEGRNPHREFDTNFYLHTNPELSKTGANPLVHFIQYGSAHQRLPSLNFDPEFYLEAHPDVLAAGMDPLVHFARHGAAEGRMTHRPLGLGAEPASFLPSHERSESPGNLEIDIVIPVFKGVRETEACIESVLANLTPQVRVIVVNDCSPEPELALYLRNRARDGSITLIENPRNLGFVNSVNVGMSMSKRDVILLNSDTLVFGDWIHRLSACAYSEPRIGTVTPFSNNATICSYPAFCVNNEINPEAAAEIDRAFAEVNGGRSVNIPTAVGFCTYIRRECLDETGLFDSDAFGTGYGEENDFCMRASSRDWIHKLSSDVFVYHAGSVSFGESSQRQQAAMRVLVGKHPIYPSLVQEHVRADPAKAHRVAVTCWRIRNSGKRVFLSVVHGLGGGVSQHSRELAASTAGEVIWLSLQPASTGKAILECREDCFSFNLTLDCRAEFEHMATILKACGVERIHIHHLMGNEVDLARLTQELRVPFDFTVHDYYSICPQVTLSDEHGRYCGEPEPQECDRCIRRRPADSNITDILSWRAKHGWVARAADRVIAPSIDAASRIRRHHRNANVLAAMHSGTNSCGLPAPRHLAQKDRLRIATLGVLAIHKGFHLFEECARSARRSRLPLDFILIGCVESGIKGVKQESLLFRETGQYEPKDLGSLIETERPDLIWFPARVPETFSYTLSTVLDLGVPAAVPDLGALPERVAGRPWSWILPWESSAEQWIEFFLRIRTEHFVAGLGPPRTPLRAAANPDYYPESYLCPTQPSRRTSASEESCAAGKPKLPLRVSALVAAGSTGQIQACGYIRILQPLTHPSVTDLIDLDVANVWNESQAQANVVLVQRIAVPEITAAKRLIEACRRRGARVIFEIDDDLLHIPMEHPEYSIYLPAITAARWLARNADAVLTSTDTLRNRMAEINANTVALPNYLDERLWLEDTPSGSVAENRGLESGRVRILYFGTASHRDELEFLGRAIHKLPRRLRDIMSLEVAGVAAHTGGADWFEVLRVPGWAAASYPHFVQWLRKENRWHWGVAPLLDTPFNRCKSAIKFLEYAALGIPSICSDMDVYRGEVSHEQTGLLARNRPEDWAEILERAISDRELWRFLRGQCRSIAAGSTVAANANRIKATWRHLTDDASALVRAGRG